ncbi:MAG: hypothetical protein PVJ21_03955 [Anaerolineales bacterium]|jgi:hypothetical protein
MKSTFDVILLIGRPASGKSEIIHFLKNLSDDARRERFHIADLEVYDDFPMLWAWFEEDNLLSEKFGLPRLYSDGKGYFKFPELWHLLIERLSLDYGKLVRDDPSYHEHTTCMIEFSRGAEHGGYAEAFQHLSDEVLEHAALMYVRVPFDESLRKNRRRFNPDKPDSILEHGLSDEKMRRLYQEDDFAAVAPGDSGQVEIRNLHVPFIVFPNEDDVTTDKPDQLAARLESVLGELWDMYSKKQVQKAASELVTDYETDDGLRAFSDLDGDDFLDDVGEA